MVTTCNYDLTIIGAGIIGAMIAKELSQYNIKVAILEKKTSPGSDVSKAGLSALHSPDFCPNNSLKEKFCINAFDRYKNISEELNVRFKEFDELRLAFKNEDLLKLEKYKEYGESLGLYNYEILNQQNIKKIEPFVTEKAIGALKIKKLGSIYPPEWCFALLEYAQINGVEVFLDTEVTGIEKIGNIDCSYVVKTTKGNFHTKSIVNCAGLYVDKIAAMIGDNYIKINYEKATMAILDKSVSYLTDNMIYGSFSPTHSQVIAPTAHGNLIIGLGYFTKPDNKEDVSIERGKIKEIANMAKQLIPGINERDIITSFSGIKSENDLTNKDFYIDYSKTSPGIIHVVIGSPGLTAAPAISEYVSNLLNFKYFKLLKKETAVKKREIIKRYSELDKDEVKKIIETNPKYAKIICRCEKITEAEIIEAVRRGAVTVDAVKHYTRAGMGRCQGGFCGPAILNIISRELECPIIKINKNNNDSVIVKGYTKQTEEEVLYEKY